VRAGSAADYPEKHRAGETACPATVSFYLGGFAPVAGFVGAAVGAAAFGAAAAGFAAAGAAAAPEYVLSYIAITSRVMSGALAQQTRLFG